jgi:pimeloyl-ACP methyl ester carboxylesterase
MSTSVFQPLPVEPSFFGWRGYQIASYEAGIGPPVLLIHSINAAASSFEMRGPFAGLQHAFHVQAIDLLGFGRSDRPDRRYTPDDYIDLIGDTLRQRNEPTAIIASTLGAAYAVAAATRWPALVRSLVLVCPTGIELLADPPGSVTAVSYAVLHSPVGEAIYKGLATRPSVRYFLEQQTYANPKNVTPETFEGFYRATKHPGAMYAPICFVSGLLNYNIRDEFARLTQPVLIVWGRQAKITKLKQADAFLKRNPQARLEVFDNCGMIVQDECSTAFNELAAAFLRETSSENA